MSSTKILPAGSGEVTALAKRGLLGEGTSEAVGLMVDAASGSGLVRCYEADDEGAVASVWHRSGRAAYVYLPTWQAFEAHEARRVFREVILPSCDVWVAAMGAGWSDSSR